MTQCCAYAHDADINWRVTSFPFVVHSCSSSTGFVHSSPEHHANTSDVREPGGESVSFSDIAWV
jgi:hypothetical protein